MPTPAIVWRPTVQSGSYFYVWAFDNPDLGWDPWMLTGSAGPVKVTHAPIGPCVNWYDRYFHSAVYVPASLAPGDYRLWAGAADLATVKVVAPPMLRPRVVLRPPDNAIGAVPAIEALIERGMDVDLAPGAWMFTRPLRVTRDDVLIRGYGATILGVPNGAYADHMIKPADGVMLEGMTFKPVNWLFGEPTPPVNAVNVTMQDCDIVGGSLGRWGANDGFLCSRCRFDRAGIAPATGGLFLSCRLEGGAPGHSFVCEGALTSPLALIGCEFDSTDRGLNFRNGWGPVRDVLVSGLSLRGIKYTQNGNELLNFEGAPDRPGVERMLVLHVRSSDCDGQVLFWNCPVRDAKFWDGVLADGTGILVSGFQGAVHTGIEFAGWELRGCGVDARGATGATFRDCVSVGWQPTRGNSGWQDMRPEGAFLTYPEAVFQGSPATQWLNCLAIDRPPGMRDFAGGSKR